MATTMELGIRERFSFSISYSRAVISASSQVVRIKYQRGLILYERLFFISCGWLLRRFVVGTPRDVSRTHKVTHSTKKKTTTTTTTRDRKIYF
jgi:hypothetical protein